MTRILFFIFLTVFFSHQSMGQFGYGLTASNDLYQRYVNPDDGKSKPSAGSVLLNIGMGPKIWLGGKNMSFSAEAQAVLGILGLSASEYKGLGTFSVPVIAKLNFKGLSTFDREGKLGWSIGGGIQYNKTELYGLTEEFAKKGVNRKFFHTYIVQGGFGFGLSGFTAHGIIRYGFNSDDKTSTVNIGLQYDFNAPMLKKITNPESEL
jgi:hypothetical protein